jgi:purine-binding chemotaxis protein CheW
MDEVMQPESIKNMKTDSPWVILRLGERIFGIPSDYVIEMVVIPALSSLPAAPDYVRGVINLRGSVIMVMDLRIRLNMESALVEGDRLIQLMEDRKLDHINWLHELENAVKENREFKLATDPHKCKFGIWYDTYKPKNVIMENHLKKFDEPHKHIHSLAVTAFDMIKHGKKEQALEIVEHEKHGTLETMINLFNTAGNLLRETSREIVLVLTHGDRKIGITVDSVESVEPLKENSFEEIELSIIRSSSIVSQTGKLVKTDKIVMLIDIPILFEGTVEIDTGGEIPQVATAVK